MNILKFIKKTKFFTLIELIVVIVVLGILAAIVIPNISSFQEEAEHTSIVSNVRNLQTSVDMFILENNGQTPTKETPTLGNPQTLEIYGLHPEHTRELPKNKGVHWWLDYNNTVWASYVDAPKNVEFITETDGTTKLTWDTVDGAKLYKIYKSEDATISSVKSPKGLKFLQDVYINVGNKPSKELPTLTKGSYLVSAVDKFDFETAPIKMGIVYEGYKEPDKDFLSSINAVNENKNEESSLQGPILKEVPEGWIGIYTVEDLKNIKNNLSGKYILMENLDLGEYDPNATTGNWNPIVTFTGQFDGNGLVIKNLKVYSNYGNVGLFGGTRYATIKNLGIENAYVKGEDWGVGILVGKSMNSTVIENSYVTGVVKGGLSTGGLVGEIHDSGIVKNSYSNATILETDLYYGNYYGGSLVGYLSKGTIENSYSTGKVIYGGGLVGISYGTIINSYWDIDSSTKFSSAGGTGLNTSEMKKENTYVDWNFDSTWKIQEGVDYPRLLWEKTVN